VPAVEFIASESPRDKSNLIRALQNRISRQNWTIEQLRLQLHELRKLRKSEFAKKEAFDLEISFDNMPQLKTVEQEGE